MTCDLCSIPIDYIIDINPLSHVGCQHCNADHKHLYPKKAKHLGIQNDYHVFRYNIPFKCPGCRTLIDKALVLCEGDGYFMELARVQEDYHE